MVGTKKDLFHDDESSSSSSDDTSTSTSSSSTTSIHPSKTNTGKEGRESSNDNHGLRLTVNKKFATKYQSKKEQEELRHIRQRKQRDGITDFDGTSESDFSDEEEDQDGTLSTPSFNIQFLKTIKALRKKDASIYDPTAQFFSDDVEKDDDTDITKTKARTPKRYKDIVREQILEQIEGEESGNAKEVNSTNLIRRSRLRYDNEQDELREAFLTQSSAVESGENEVDWMVMKKKVITSFEDEVAKEVKEELKEVEHLFKKSKKDDTFKDPRGEIGDGECYLLDFITKKKWIDHNDINFTGNSDDEESSLDGVERADEYESNYNFRFEEAAQETASSGAALSVQAYARSQTINTVRRQDTTRKDKRQARKDRKAAERKAKEDQLRRLRNAKKKEINDKLLQVKAVIGGLEESAVDEATIMRMIEGDYEPEKFEKAMEQAYGEDFYEKKDKEWKTDLDVRRTLNGDDEGDALVGQDDVNGGMYDNVQEYEVIDDLIDGEYDESGEWDDDIYDRCNGESKLEKKLKAKMQEELYKLDYEDIVAGMPTRFKYREVESNDYGLTTQEILFARDKTLKQFVSLQKMAPYNQEGEHNVGSKKRRKFREMLKTDLEENLSIEVELLNNSDGTKRIDAEPKKKRRRLKKGKKSKVDIDSSGIDFKRGSETKVLRVKQNACEEFRSPESGKKRSRKKKGKKRESLDKLNAFVLDADNTNPRKQSKEVAESETRKVNSDIIHDKFTNSKEKKKRKKMKEKKSSITGISHSRLASYGLL